MIGILFIELICNAILFTFIFWTLTFLAKCTYSNKFFNYKLTFYECGFKNFSKKAVVYELNFILLILFLLVYDGEFFILIPFALNSAVLTYEIGCCMFLFFVWFILILLLDFSYHSLDWQVKDLLINFFNKTKNYPYTELNK